MRSRAPAAARVSPHSYAVSKRIPFFVELTKPGISLFVAMSAATGYVVSAQDSATWAVALLVMVCTALMSGGAAALNQVIEAGRDRNMRRTAQRPVAAGLVSARAAELFAWSLTGVGLLLALTLLPPLASVFLVLCHISYVNMYTPLKLRTSLCTLVGGFPGSLPVLAGAAASVHGITLPAILLTGVLFAWQMPHFMAIGWLAREDYARVNYVMLFLTEPTGWQSAAVAVMYAAVMGGCAVLLAVALSTSALFFTLALLTSAVFTGLSLAFLRHRERTQARRLFFSSLLILPVLLTTLVVELLVLR
ncbi:MAG TPA: heme o synthase [Longimicrobiales bacterium]